MSLTDRIDREKATSSATDSVMGALTWLIEARANLGDPNSDAAYRMRVQHARQGLLEAVAALDMRPAASRPLPRRVTGDGA